MMLATRLRGRLPKERSRWAGLQPVPGHRGRCGAVPPLRFYRAEGFPLEPLIDCQGTMCGLRCLDLHSSPRLKPGASWRRGR